MKKFFSKAQFLLLLIVTIACNKANEFVFTADSFEIVINDKGQLNKLINLKTNKDYLFQETEQSSILGIKVAGQLEYPSFSNYNKENEIITLNYPKHNIVAEVKIIEKDTYITFELISITEKDKIELVIWGPFNTVIKETIGETIGVVRNSKFAIGIQALNMRTLGGYPANDDDSTPSFNIFGTTSLVDVPDSLNILYRGNTALPKEYGSALQAYTRNRSKDRVVASMSHEKYLAPSFKDIGIIGSKIALFGCDPIEVLNTIEAIELKEGLPHPLLDGAWNKRVATATSAYLIQNFTSETIDEAIALTKKAGLKYLYHPGPFENWGQFDLNKKSFPDNWESMKVCVDKAEKEGIKIGLHTLSNFITTNDPYVTPIPDDRLAKVGSGFLVKAIHKDQKNIEISDPTYFNQMKNNSLHAVVIEKELIRYEAVSETEPWMLLNCQRGAFGTNAAAHEKGVKISKLIDHAYKTFLTNTELSVEMAGTLADLYNKTGVKQISFDGLEGNFSTGMGAYGQLLFVDAWYSKLKPEIKDDYVMDASRSGHYFWHMFTRMNWGEPWYADFRESQTAYRILNQDYFRRNYIPSMLGWFSMRANTSIEDIEWMLARSAAFDAGYALVTSPELVGKNGFATEILEKIKQWEKARISNAFTADQKKRMEDIKAEFTLDNVSENGWDLTPFSVQRFEHKFRIRQPGEPVSTRFSFKNEYDTQPLQFILKTTKGTTASDITIEIDDFKKIDLNVSILEGQYLKYTGGNTVILYDETWNKIKEIPINSDTLIMSSGTHKLKVDCKFSANDESSLKLELKTAGIPEKVTIKE
jgi:hypothetical protein